MVRASPSHLSFLQLRTDLQDSSMFPVTPLGAPPPARAPPASPAHLQGDVIDLHVVGAPLAEQLDVGRLRHRGGRSLPLVHPGGRTAGPSSLPGNSATRGPGGLESCLHFLSPGGGTPGVPTAARTTGAPAMPKAPAWHPLQCQPQSRDEGGLRPWGSQQHGLCFPLSRTDTLSATEDGCAHAAQSRAKRH